MKRFVKTLMVAGALLPLTVPAIDAAENNNRHLRTDLSGFNEVHPPTLEQKWHREVEAIIAWCIDSSPANTKAKDFAEDRTNEALLLLFNAHRDAEQRACGIQPAA